jgi:CheY-like chemotaxis protein
MKILIVEDSKAARAIIRSEFDDSGYVLQEAATGADALKALANQKFDLITMDIGLPDMSGFDLCDKPFRQA